MEPRTTVVAHEQASAVVVVEVALADIDTQDTSFQYRFSVSVRDLRHSLRSEGQHDPITLNGRKPHRIIDGFRRVQAAQELGWRSVKAFVHRGMSDDDAWRVAFTKNVVRRNLTPIERANAILLAQKRGVKKSELAGLFAISERQLRRYLELLELPKQVKQILDGKIVTMAHAKLLADAGIREDAESWKQRIAQEQLDSRALKRVLKRELGKRSPGRRKLYLKKESGSLRVYPFKLSKDSPKVERERAIKALQEALDMLKEW